MQSHVELSCEKSALGVVSQYETHVTAAINCWWAFQHSVSDMLGFMHLLEYLSIDLLMLSSRKQWTINLLSVALKNVSTLFWKITATQIACCHTKSDKNAALSPRRRLRPLHAQPRPRHLSQSHIDLTIPDHSLPSFFFFRFVTTSKQIGVALEANFSPVRWSPGDNTVDIIFSEESGHRRQL